MKSGFSLSILTKNFILFKNDCVKKFNFKKGSADVSTQISYKVILMKRYFKQKIMYIVYMYKLI